MTTQYLDWWTYKLLSLMYDDKELARVLSEGTGNWFVIPARDEKPYNGTAYDEGMRRAKNFFLN